MVRKARVVKRFAADHLRPASIKSKMYGSLVVRLIRRTRRLMLAFYAVLLGGTAYLVESPKGYIPGQDRGYFIIAIPQLPARVFAGAHHG